MRIAGAIFIFLACLFLALATGWSLLFRVAYLLGAILAIGYLWARLGLRRLQVEVERRTEQSQVGQVAEQRFWVRNLDWLPKLWLEVRDNSDLPGYEASQVLSLSAHQRRSWLVRTICQQRGRFTLGPIAITSRDPLGLFRRQRNVGRGHTLLVYPATVELPYFSLASEELTGEGHLRRRTHRVTPTASGVREYAYGDSFNRIHWATTARTRRLMVKEFEFETSKDIWVLLDMEAGVQAGAGLESTEEYGVTIGASVAKRFLQGDRSVGFLAYGKPPLILEAAKGSHQMLKVMEGLALIRATGTVPLAHIVASEGRRFSRQAALIIITSSTAEEWVPGLLYLKRRGLGVVVILLEPGTFGGRDGSLFLVGSLATNGVPVYMVKKGDALERALSPGLLRSRASP